MTPYCPESPVKSKHKVSEFDINDNTVVPPRKFSESFHILTNFIYEFFPDSFLNYELWREPLKSFDSLGLGYRTRSIDIVDKASLLNVRSFSNRDSGSYDGAIKSVEILLNAINEMPEKSNLAVRLALSPSSIVRMLCKHEAGEVYYPEELLSIIKRSKFPEIEIVKLILKHSTNDYLRIKKGSFPIPYPDYKPAIEFLLHQHSDVLSVSHGMDLVHKVVEGVLSTRNLNADIDLDRYNKFHYQLVVGSALKFCLANFDNIPSSVCKLLYDFTLADTQPSETEPCTFSIFANSVNLMSRNLNLDSDRTALLLTLVSSHHSLMRILYKPEDTVAIIKMLKTFSAELENSTTEEVLYNLFADQSWEKAVTHSQLSEDYTRIGKFIANLSENGIENSKIKKTFKLLYKKIFLDPKVEKNYDSQINILLTPEDEFRSKATSRLCDVSSILKVYMKMRE